MSDPPFIHPSAVVAASAVIGPASHVWHHAQVCEGAVIGRECIVGKDAYIDVGVQVGDRVKIQNGALVYHGATLEDGVFIGPRAVLANDRYPRAITPDGRLKGQADWVVGEVLVRYGAAVGAGAVVLPGVTIGRWALIAAGAVVTAAVPDHGLVAGVPGRLVGAVCPCGRRLRASPAGLSCPSCGWLLTEVEGAR
jgi:UDP-2-acetamido-3-amino-2,3-dideoxy-glucuronate N-acetyltransferase